MRYGLGVVIIVLCIGVLFLIAEEFGQKFALILALLWTVSTLSELYKKTYNSNDKQEKKS